MSIEDYIPTTFDVDTMHPLKCLWLYDRKTELFLSYMNQVKPGDMDSYRKINPYRLAMQDICQETGMTPEDVLKFSNIGGYIREYIDMTQMLDDDLQARLDVYENKIELTSDDLETFVDFWSQIQEQQNKDKNDNPNT